MPPALCSWREICFLPGYCHQRAIQHVDREVGIVGRNAHRRLDAKDVAVESAFPNENSHFARGFERGQRFRFRWFFCLSIANQLDAEHEAHAADVTDQRMTLRQPLESILQSLAEHA